MPDHDLEYVAFVEAATVSLRRTAYLICGDWHRADDVVQDALYKLYLSWSKVDRRGNPLAYARRIVANAAVDSSRRSWRREVPTGEPLETSGVSDGTGGRADRDELLAVLAQLPRRQRACVVLRHCEDLSIEQTAEILGCAPGTVKSQTARGLEALRHALNHLRSTGRHP